MANDLVSGTQARKSAQNANFDGVVIDLFEWVRVLWRGKWVIALVALVAISIGGYYAYRVAIPVFSAKTVVVLETRQDQVVDIASVMTGLSGDQASINTEIEVLKSRGLIEKLVLRMDLMSDPEFNSRLQKTPVISVGNLRAIIFGAPVRSEPSAQKILDTTVDAVLRSISISNVRQSYVFNIKVLTTSPTKSANIANTLAELYILDQLEVKFEATEQATTWLSDRVATLQSDLEIAESKMKAFSAATSLVSAEALEIINRRVKDARGRLDKTNMDLAQYAEQLKTLSRALTSGDRNEMAAVAADNTLNRALSIESGEEAFDARFQLILQKAQVDVDRASAQARSFTQSILDMEGEYARQSEDLVELQQLQREAEANRLIYEFFLGRLKEMSVQEGIQQADSRVLSTAAVPSGATAPRKSLIMALSAMLGLMLGAGVIILRELLHNGFRSADQLAVATGYTVMGQIPKIQARTRRDVTQYLADKPTSAATEAVRNLRTSVLLSNVDTPPEVIMVTSSIPSEGKTTVSIALAQNFAGMGKKVLLVEGDIRRRTLNNYFNLSGTNGVLSIVSGETEISNAVQCIDSLGIDIIVGEKSNTNASDVFSSVRFKDFIEQARALYDIIIIDTPPVLVVPDARVIAQIADSILYCVEWDKTSRNQVIEGLHQLEMVNVQVSGLVLGKVDPKGMKRYGYGDQYGAYSAYGKSYYEA